MDADGDPARRLMTTRLPAQQVRVARREDFPAMARVLARAFHEDPLTTWLYPRERSRDRHVERSFMVSLSRLAPQNQLYTTDDHAGGALWALPGQWREDLRQSVSSLTLLPPLLPRLLRTMRAMARIEIAHPADAHYYLSVLGTAPERRREGVGSALLRPVLDLCDAERIPAYLETATEANVGFYARHGFEVQRRLELPGGAPSLWLLWREPDT
jgi:ribosomal protein S18 acetylase RimI-like enzyme